MSEGSFQPQKYLRFDLSQGLVSTPDKRRHLIVPAELLRAAGSAEDLVGAARRWGEEQGINIRNQAGEDILDQSPERFVTELSHLLATIGWGCCELESWGGVLFIVVKQAPRGAANEILNGFLAGAFSSASGQRFDCVPLVESGLTRFLLTGPEYAVSIRSWVENGATPGEVTSRMLAGEHLSGQQPSTGGR